MTDSAYDLVVVGGGTAGISAAQAAVALGRAPLIISEGPLGGECTWNGCVPSKALIHAARLHHEAARAGQFGIRVEGLRVDFPEVMRRVRGVVADIARFEDEGHLGHAGIGVRRGQARLAAKTSASETTVVVDGDEVRARRVVVATGSRPLIPPVPGLEDVPYLTNETLFDLDVLPARLLVLGAGPIGLEMAQAFARLGSEVEVIDVVPDLLPREDAAIAVVARRLLERDGVRFMLGATATSVTFAGGTFTVKLAIKDSRLTLEGDALLVAAGRRPHVDGLGLKAAGVAVGSGGVTVDAHLRTSSSCVYAAGDVTGILPFTHVAAYQGRLAARNALGKGMSASYRTVPWIIFTDPEIAHVGLTEPEARAQYGDDIHTAALPFTAVDRAVIAGEPEGLIKVVTKGRLLIGHAGGGTVLGAHIIGPGAGELIHEFVLAMQLRAFSGRLAQAIHAYPSMSIGVQQTVAQLFDVGRTTAGEMRAELSEFDGPASRSFGGNPPDKRDKPTGHG